MSRKGDCWDNAVAESFFGTLKQEMLFRRELEPSLAVQTALFEYLETYYNPKRRHSTLGFLSSVYLKKGQTERAQTCKKTVH